MHWTAGQLEMRATGLQFSGVTFALLVLLTDICIVCIPLVISLSPFVNWYRVLIPVRSWDFFKTLRRDSK
jgi:hypothetical protein